MTSDTRRTSGGVLQGLLLGPILFLLLNGLLAHAAPRPKPVHVYEGYSSISKSVTVTKRLEFNMNKDQTLDEAVTQGSDEHELTQNETERHSNSSDPLINRSVQYSIATNLPSDVDGDLLPPMTLESITNDLSEMQKMAKNIMKKSEDKPTADAGNSSDPLIELEVSDQATTEYPSAWQFATSFRSVDPEDSKVLKRIEGVPETSVSEFEDAELSTTSRNNLVKKGEVGFISDVETEHSSVMEESPNISTAGENTGTFTTVTEPTLTTFVQHSTTLSGDDRHSSQDSLPTTEAPAHDTVDRNTDDMNTKSSTEEEMASQLPTVQNTSTTMILQTISTTTPPADVEVEDFLLQSSSTESPMREDVKEISRMKPEEGELMSTERPEFSDTVHAESILNNGEDERIEDVITTTEDVLYDQTPEEYYGDNYESGLGTDYSLLQTDDYITETISKIESISTTAPSTNTELPIQTTQKDDPIKLNDISDPTSSSVSDDLQSDNLRLRQKDSTTEPVMTMDTIDMKQFHSTRSSQEKNVNNESYDTDILTNSASTTPNTIDYISLDVGESIEIGGSFPSEAPIPMEPTLVPAQAASPQLSQTADEAAAAPELKAPSLDLASMVSQIDFSKIDLANIDLSKLDLSGIGLDGLNLSEVPSDLNLKDFDLSKLPPNLANLNIGNLDLSSLDLSGFNNRFTGATNLARFPSEGNGNLFESQSTDALQNEPKVELTGSNISDSSFGEIDAPHFESNIRQNHFNPSVVPPFLPPNFHFDALHQKNEPSRGPPAFIPTHFNFRPPHGLNSAPHRSPHGSNQYILVDDFGNGQFVDPSSISIQQQGQVPDPNSFSIQREHGIPESHLFNLGQQGTPEPHLFNLGQQQRLPGTNQFNIHRQQRIPDLNPFNIHQHQRIPDIDPENKHTERAIEKAQFFNHAQSPPSNKPFFQSTDNRQVKRPSFDGSAPGSVDTHTGPQFDFANVDMSNLPGNLNLGDEDFSRFDLSKLPSSLNEGELDLSDLPANLDLGGLDLSKLPSNLDLGGLDFSKLPSNFDLSGLDLSGIPSNFSFEGLNLSEISSNLDLSSLDLSKIDFSTIDISGILKQISGPPSNQPSQSQVTTEQQDDSQDADYSNLYDYNDDHKMNMTHFAPMRAEITPSSRQWVTEDEADRQLVDELGISHLVSMATGISFDGSGNVDFLMCTMCKTGVVTGKKLMNDLNKSDREIKSLIIHICVQFGLFPVDVCRGIINLVGDEVLHVLRNTVHTPDSFCGMMLTSQCEPAPLPAWKLELTPGRGALRPDPITPPKIGALKILHISDLHLDSEYSEGSDADCGYPLCCRDWGRRRDGKTLDLDTNKTKTPIDMIASKVMADADDPSMDTDKELMSTFKFPKAAGRWGAFGWCDLPLETIDDLLEAGAALQPDIVYVTGDLPPHDVWQQTRRSVAESNAITSERIRRAFPDTPVVMTVGNHEIVPINSFPVPSVYSLGYNPSWLYESLAEQWESWVPQESMESLRKGGYYSVSPLPGLRVLSVNGNYCNEMNWWLLVAHKDPTSHLKWLDEQLAAAVAAGEKVHILTHIPPGNPDCEHSWSHQFATIVASYADVVMGVFSGHQHMDQWQVIFDPDNSTRAVSVVYVAPSATTYREHSPSFRMYSVDGSRPGATWSVANYDTYTANLTIANLPGNSPRYNVRYSAMDAFSMPDLSPSSWVAVVDRMAGDQQMFNEHMRFKHNYWAEPTEVSSCDKECKEKSLCFLVTGDSSNSEPCNRVKQIVTL